MDETSKNILQNLAERTQSELIVFFILFAVAMIPFYRLIIKDRKSRSEQENARQDKLNEREKEIIHVIRENSEVNSGLKTMLEMNNSANVASLTRIHDRIDALCGNTSDVATALTKSTAMLDEIVRRQVTNADDIKKILTEGSD